jgi:hypothetical protein
VRYRVTPPVPGGYDWWNVIDTRAEEYGQEDNFAVAEFFAKIPNAEQEAQGLCDRLNAHQAQLEAQR